MIRLLWVSIAISAVAVGGCSDSERQTAIDQSQQAVNSAEQSISKGWANAMSSVKGLDTGSTKEQLQRGLDDLKSAEAQAQGEGKKLLAKAEEQRVQTAIEVKDLETQLDRKLAEVQRLKDRVMTSNATAQDELAKAEKAAQDARDALSGENGLYERAKKEADDLHRQAGNSE